MMRGWSEHVPPYREMFQRVDEVKIKGKETLNRHYNDIRY